MRYRSWAVAVFLSLILVKGAYAQNTYDLPHFANGKFGAVSFRTTFILFNNTNSPAVALLAITDDSGNPLSTTIGGLGSGSQFTISLGAGETSILQTDGSGNGAVGAAKVTATVAIGVSAIFTVYDANGNYMTEAGVGSSDPQSDFVLPVDSTGSFLTGLALFNPDFSDASITLTLINTDGSQADSPASKSLVAGGHTAFFVAAAGQLFPTVTNFRGTLRVQSSVPIAALVLRQYQNTTQLSYTSLPAVPSSSTNVALNIAQAANGSYGSISFKTSFLIFNISTSTANVVLSLTKDNGTAFVVTFPGSGPGTGTNSTFSFSLAPGASVFLQTDGLGAGTAGSATIMSNVPIGASAIFTVFNAQGQFQTEAGVGDSPVLTSLTIPVDLTGTFDTGVAFFNPGSGSVVLSFTLLDSTGTIAGSGSQQTLAAKNHLAIFVDQLFPGTKNFRGSLAVSATAGVAATTLRQNSVSSTYVTYTTLPTASGAASGKAPVAVLLSKTETGIAATSNVTLNETLPSGFKLSGTVTGPAGSRGSLVTASAGGSNQYDGSINVQTNKYLIVLPAGTYNLRAIYQPAGVPAGASVGVSYSDPTAVQVSGDTTRDITLPPVTLYSVSGTVSGLSTLPASLTQTIAFASSGQTATGGFSLNASGNYTGVLPSGSYIASVGVGIQPSLTQFEEVEFYNLGSLTVSGGPATGNYAIPATATLSGAVHVAGLTSLPEATAVGASDTSASQIGGASSVGNTDTSGQYQLILANNRSYAVGVSIGLTQGTTIIGEVTYPVTADIVSVTGNTTHDIDVPALPGQFTISGQVKNGSGNGVASVTVAAFSKSITGAANVQYTGSAITDAQGHYSMIVLSGTDYTIEFVPPAPQP